MSSSLRLLVLSDLHVDYPQNLQKVPALVAALGSQEADAFVLAGDISHKLAHIEAVLGAFGRLAVPKFFVAGNHDVWIVREGREPVKDSWEKLARVGDIAERHGFVFLETRNGRVGDFTFVGSMGWYDYSYAAPALPFSEQDYREKRWQDLTYMDRAYARWGQPDEEVCQRLTAGVEARLAHLDGPVIYVSHHVPREEWVLRRGHPSWDFFNAYMGSRRTEEVLRRRAVRRFVFGHTHRPVGLVEPQRFVINNPLGYPRQALTPLTRPFVVT